VIFLNKILYLILFSVLLSSCSFHDSGGFWSEEKDISKDKIKFIPFLKKEKKIFKEFNPNLKLLIDKNSFKVNDSSYLDNNDGYNQFKGDLKKIKKYSFSKIKNFYKLEPNLIFFKKNIIFFDNKGSIFSFDENSKLNWKSNNYSKEEKKIGPLLSISIKDDIIIVADSLSNFYALSATDGKVLWSKKNNSSFNSQLKIYKNLFFVLDVTNNLNCFSIKNGNKLWSHSTENSFINSSTQLSIIVKNEKVVFSNSLGDITALDIYNGKLLWQISVIDSRILEDVMNLKMSSLVENENSIFFSNNLGKFYSIDLETGSTNWTQEINADVRPTVLENLVFTISQDGFLFIIEKNTGNIIRTTNLNYKTKFNKQNLVVPTGFIMNSKNLFVSTSRGNFLLVDIISGKTIDALKIDSNKISRGFIYGKNIYLIRDNSIIRLN